MIISAGVYCHRYQLKGSIKYGDVKKNNDDNGAENKWQSGKGRHNTLKKFGKKHFEEVENPKDVILQQERNN